MIIIRRSPVSGHTNTMNLDVTQDSLDDWNSGVLVQDAMPNLSADEREFIMTGIMPHEWTKACTPRNPCSKD